MPSAFNKIAESMTFFESGYRAGLYIGQRFVALAELRKDLKRTELVRSASIEVQQPPGISVSMDSPNLLEALKRLCGEARIQSKRVAVGLRGSDMIIRSFQIPLLPRREWEGACRYEAQKYLPFSIKELDFGFQTLAQEDKKTLKVVFMGAKKESTHQLLNLLNKAGLAAAVLEPVALSLIRVLAGNRRYASSDTLMLVHLERGFINTLVIKEGMPLLTRYGALALRDESSVDFESLRGDIRLSFDYLVKNFKTEQVGRIVLCVEGGGAEASRAISQSVGVPVDLWNPMEVFGAETRNHAVMSCAVGCALKGLARDKHKGVNLAPKIAQAPPPILNIPDLNPVEEKRLLKRCVVIEGVALALFVLFVYFVSGMRLALIKREISKIETQNAQLSVSLPDKSLEALSDVELRYMKKSKFLASLIPQRTYWTDKMNQISREIPDGIWLTQLDYADRQTTTGEVSRTLFIQGNILEQEPRNPVHLVNRFATDLSKNSRFMTGLSDVRVSFIRKGNAGGAAVTQFGIECELTAGSEKAAS